MSLQPFRDPPSVPPCRAQRRLRGHRPVRGLTLIELMCTLAVVAVLATLAVPSLQRWAALQALAGAAAELETDVHLARSEALARQVAVRLSVQPLAEGNCYLVHTGRAGDCRCDAGAVAHCEGGATALRTAAIGQRRSLALAGARTSVAFDPQFGTATPAATVELHDAHGRAIRQVINVMGRVRSCSPSGSVPGMGVC